MADNTPLPELHAQVLLYKYHYHSTQA
jgi:hypothetical protein